MFTVGAVLAYGGLEALVVHRIARFEDVGFALGTVTLWAAVSGLLTLPGRFVLPVLAGRARATVVFAAVLAVLAAAAGLMIEGGAYWQLALSFVLFGLVFGSALPLRAVVMSEWTAPAVFGTVMGVQAALIAIGRAGVPALVGGLHDRLDGYAGGDGAGLRAAARGRAAGVCQRASSSRDERVDAARDLLAGRAHRVDRLALGVGQVPVEVALAGDVGAGVAAAHGHDDVGVFGELAREWLRAGVRRDRCRARS